jgi:hypothetical protein
MTKAETIQEISRVLLRYRGPEYTAMVMTDLFAEHVASNYGNQAIRKAQYRKMLLDLREEFDA